jgi:hypothetical protein
MRTFSLVLVVASMACYREAAVSPSLGPSAAPPIANKSAPRAEPVASRDVLAYLPVDSEIVMRLDVKRVRASELWAEYEPMVVAALGVKLTEVRDKCGFDPIGAIDSVTFGLRGASGKDGVIVLRGWERDKLMACLEAERAGGDTSLVANDRGILTFRSKDGKQHVAGFADRSTLVFHLSSHATSEDMRVLLRGGAPLRRSPTFLALYERLSRDVAVWFLMTGNAGVLRALPSSGPKMRGMYGTIDVGASVVAAAHVLMDDVNQAAQIAVVLDQYLQQARPMFDRLRATSDGDVITIECELSSAQLRTLAGLAFSMFAGLGATP